MDSLSKLVAALRYLPGVGPKSALRMAHYLLQDKREQGLELASCLQDAMRRIGHCEWCNNFTETDRCSICLNPNRDAQTLCVVETPSDVMAIEQSSSFEGYYFVLMNKISPIEGIGPDDIDLPKLKARVEKSNLKEIIVALSPTVEGRTTTYFIQDLFRDAPVEVSQLAHGIPSGGELEFLDSHTIGSALQNRSKLNKASGQTSSNEKISF